MDKQKIVILGAVAGASAGYMIHPEGREAYQHALTGGLFGGIATAAYFAYEHLKNDGKSAKSGLEKRMD